MISFITDKTISFSIKSTPCPPGRPVAELLIILSDMSLTERGCG